MAEKEEVTVRSVTIHLRPFEDPGAQDYYMNLTGVVNMQHEVILMFARALPVTRVPKSREVNVAPQLRVALPCEAARHLLAQLTQQIELRDRMEAESPSGESGDAGSSDSR